MAIIMTLNWSMTPIKAAWPVIMSLSVASPWYGNRTRDMRGGAER